MDLSRGGRRRLRMALLGALAVALAALALIVPRRLNDVEDVFGARLPLRPAPRVVAAVTRAPSTPTPAAAPQPTAAPTSTPPSGRPAATASPVPSSLTGRPTARPTAGVPTFRRCTRTVGPVDARSVP